MRRILRRRRAATVVAVSVATSLGLGACLQAANGGTAAPAFVQAASAHGASTTSLSVSPSSNAVAGNRMVVEVGVWSSAGVTASSVTDSAGDTYVELLHFTAGDKTEMSVWTAPIVTGTQTRPTIKVKPTAKADVGAVALEYSGLSSVADASVMDRSASLSGKTSTAASVSSGATAATTSPNELAIGFYADSGFGDSLTGAGGYTTRANVSPNGDIELLAQDAVVTQGATPNPAVGTGASTWWLASTVVLKAGGGEAPPPTVPGAPTEVKASAGNGSATVSWTAPGDGNSPITSYTVTPYVGSTPQAPTTVSGAPPATTATLEGLVNGTSYTFKVTATNGVGPGPPSEASNAVIPALAAGGEWSPVLSWPFEAIHLFQLTNGNVLGMDGWANPQPTYEWNPSTQEFTSSTAPAAIFCSGLAQLPNGNVMTVGGYGLPTTGQLGLTNTAVFNPQTGQWSSLASMHAPRWYPSVTELANGKYVAISGNSTNATTWADTPEVYDPSANTWTALSHVSTPQVHEEEYPFSFLSPNGEVFTIGPSEDVSYDLNVANETWTSVGSSGITNGSAVMYRPGKILYTGGAPSIVEKNHRHQQRGDHRPDGSESEMESDRADGNIAHLPHPHNPRRRHRARDRRRDEAATRASSRRETCRPKSGIRRPKRGLPRPRSPWRGTTTRRRSCCLTGACCSAGGGTHHRPRRPPGSSMPRSSSPPYLSNGPRPTITGAPTASTYGKSITVTTPDAASISAVNLVSLGADTHQSDMSQHFVPLKFTAGHGELTVQTPSGAAIAPYGNYMLFIVNEKGVPSVSAPLNLSAAPETPGAPTGVLATASGTTATVSWNVPPQGTSAITSYTVTPYMGATAQPATTVSGSPPAATATIPNLTEGTTYTFSVTANNGVGAGLSSAPSNPITIASATAPGAPTAVSASPGDGSATVTWTAPSANGSAITGYTVTPYVGTTAGTPTTITGTPPLTTATIGGLTNGTTYSFTVAATNPIGTGPASLMSNPVTPSGTASPAFVQQVAAHGHGASEPVVPAANLTTGNRLIVEVAVWSAAKATAASVKDTAGDAFTELLHFKASDNTEMSIWSAPVTSGGGTRPTIIATPSATADVGVAAMEYSGLSTAAGTAVVDQSAQTTGKTTAAAVLSTPATGATTAPNELILGFYADSGFEDLLMARMGFNERVNVSPNGDMELLAEDAFSGAAGSTPATSVQSGGATVWLMATLVLKSASTIQAQSVPASAPMNALAFPGSGSATVTWSAARNGGSRITLYRVTPYLHGRALPATYTSTNSVLVPGLRNGRRYRFRVVAINAIGSGPGSRRSNTVEPEGWLLSLPWCSPALSPFV